MRWLLGQFFEFVFFELCSNYYSVYNNYLGCLDFRYLKSFISYMQFSRYIDDNEFSLSSGEYEIRTRDLLLARQALSQLS